MASNVRSHPWLVYRATCTCRCQSKQRSRTTSTVMESPALAPGCVTPFHACARRGSPHTRVHHPRTRCNLQSILKLRTSSWESETLPTAYRPCPVRSSPYRPAHRHPEHEKMEAGTSCASSITAALPTLSQAPLRDAQPTPENVECMYRGVLPRVRGAGEREEWGDVRVRGRDDGRWMQEDVQS